MVLITTVGCRQASLQGAPVDVLLIIIGYLSVLDIVRLGQTCRLFQQIKSHRSVWSSLYRTSRLPRPPGPYLSQPLELLQETLIRSARIQRNWGTSISRPASSFTIPIASARIQPLGLVAYRWFLLATEDAIWCYDLSRYHSLDHSEHAEFSVLYQCNGEASYQRPMRIVSTHTTDAKQLHYLVLEEMHRLPDQTVHRTTVLFGVEGVADGPVSLTEVAVLDQNVLFLGNAVIGPRALLVTGNVECYVRQDLPRRVRIFDMARENRVYQLPPHVLQETPVGEFDHTLKLFYVSTSTHIISLLTFLHETADGPQFLTNIEAFELPSLTYASNTPTEPQTLTLTHSCKVSSLYLMDSCYLLRNSAVDTLTGNTSLTVIAKALRSDSIPPSASLIRLRLSLHHHTHDIACQQIWVGNAPFRPRITLGCSSLDGCARGIFTKTRFTGRDVRSFTLDDEADPEFVMSSARIDFPTSQADDFMSRIVGFDGLRGRLCKMFDRSDSGHFLEVTDFA
ncbi:hypothetical protein CONPUDRAFT_151382 [Coniophora puteana RWD-64-598 SS2]|uniref:F-box domain-containing protein n=1 Tax=Coniophora puteana (strain RWD-64-598) TaxID=741705 RepID=A0A5M3N0E2_CONPW|nr:uncharacterized protein CONPUDRAFT_151382 [Coniophora puteana RWD-64-598 SS2]EIW84361.1 hypothetical protein CONPUDRAFT_151382 [Coniophora puteana RWD-64-598 SS2]